MATVRYIGLTELRKLQMAHPDFADEGWAVEEDGKVLDWFADKYAAEQAAAEINEEE